MSVFEDTHAKSIVGRLAMFDRMIFRGHLTRLFPAGAVPVFRWQQGVPLTGFGPWAKQATEVLCEHAQQMARRG